MLPEEGHGLCEGLLGYLGIVGLRVRLVHEGVPSRPHPKSEVEACSLSMFFELGCGLRVREALGVISLAKVGENGALNVLEI